MADKYYDSVNPTHYLINGREVWDIALDNWGYEKMIAHLEIAAFEYRMRAGKKPGQDAALDIEKALKCEYKANELRKAKGDL